MVTISKRMVAMWNRKQNQKWLTIIFFFCTITIDWLYTYSLMQAMSIITHWVILSPVLLTLFMILGLLITFGLHLHQWWGFVGAYVALVLSSYAGFLSFSAHVEHSLFYFGALMLLNIFTFVDIVIFEIMSWGDAPTPLDE